MTPGDAVGAVADTARPVSLDEVLTRAELLHRYDRKYVVSADAFSRWLLGPGEPLDVLEIGGAKQFTYESRYFDTPDLLTYRQHRQLRRRRYKIRTRTYRDTGDCCFEVKLSGYRGRTVKERIPHPLESRDRVTPSAQRLLRDVLTAHGMPLPGDLVPTLRTTYWRTTLLARDRPVRITCDVEFACDAGQRRASGPDDRVLVEVKAPRERDPFDARLAGLGVRPEYMTKYCLGMALLDPHLPANPWHPVLKRHFGWLPSRRARS